MTRDSHPSHDPYLIAQFAAGDLDGSDRRAAERLVAECPRCAELFADLRSIATATAGLPAPERPRDFRLTSADAERLRAPWRRWLGGLAQPRFSFTAPLGAALATLGLAGLLVGVLPNLAVSTGTSGAAPAPSLVDRQATAAPIPPPSIEKLAPETAGPAAAQAAPSAVASAAASAAPSILALPAPTAAPVAAAATAAPTAAPTTGEIRTTAGSDAPTPPALPQPSPSGLAAALPSDSAVAPVLGAPAASPAPDASTASEAAPPGAGATDASGTGFAGVGSAPSDNGGAQPAPSTADGAPAADANPAAPGSTSPTPTPGLGVTTGITPHRDQGRESAASPPGIGVSPLVVLSVALLLAGLVLLLARRAAVRASR